MLFTLCESSILGFYLIMNKEERRFLLEKIRSMKQRIQ